uniref:Uncharacterized protein n=1 Tax=Sinocyclocheilus grahami TaxID=75366 RepID=A0A672MUE4_SINGR
MIVIDNVGSSEAEPPRRRLSFSWFLFTVPTLLSSPSRPRSLQPVVMCASDRVHQARGFVRSSLGVWESILPQNISVDGGAVTARVCHSYSSLDWEASDESAVRLHVSSRGLLLVLVYRFISELAVYTERVLETQHLPLSLQNLFLYVFGVGINLGFSSVVWLIVVGQAANGLLMSVFPVLLIGWAVHLYCR